MKYFVLLLLLILLIGIAFAYNNFRYTNDISFLKKSMLCKCTPIASPIKLVKRFGGNIDSPLANVIYYPVEKVFTSVPEPRPNPLPSQQDNK